MDQENPDEQVDHGEDEEGVYDSPRPTTKPAEGHHLDEIRDLVGQFVDFC
jgi:hypothetical protein